MERDITGLSEICLDVVSGSLTNGRPPYPLSAMLRVYCMQLFYNLSDPAMEDALHEIEPIRQFAGLKLARLPDETAIL